ncbi:hypothetical protein M422DRAFT_271203 [Sphaerobolus stellatus SS14]|uniref:Cytochrome P450 n=1 Tax=Sphaerobolus stellatus (strain SS14) TaxID=990650 RepID=A0A0C9UQJ0_SPHS4|nr:hypothetical protein M422DRAFT_271203 [Sphaerobolus stellatus SS14]
MVPIYLLAGSFLCSLWLVRLAYKHLTKRSIDYLPGPPSGPWIVGNYPDIVRPNEMGDSELSWVKEYGTTLRIKHTFGRDRIFTTDPKALQYILNTSGYNFPKPNENRIGSEMLLGRGLVWAEGSQHARQRKIMNPAFSFAALRGFLPLFRRTAQRAVSKLKDDIFTGSDSKVVNIKPWLSLTTLDAIGEGKYHSLPSDTNSMLSIKVMVANWQMHIRTYCMHYLNFLLPAGYLILSVVSSIDTFTDRSDLSLAFTTSLAFFPAWLVHLIFRIPAGRFKRLRDYLTVSREVAQDIIDKQTSLYIDGKEGSKDVMSILVRANLSEDPKSKLSVEEILPQMTTLFLAGHDTTALTSSWALYQLSRNLDYQRLIREEIKATRVAAAERGDSELTIADLDSMKYLLAAMKETLRYHPIVTVAVREAARDDIIPLAIPQKTKTGESITSVPVSKGQSFVMSLMAYNRLPEVWGPDANQWRPERFLEGVQGYQQINLGVISNVATFSSGLRSCIGWRFAVLEMQAILIEMLESFEFSPPPGDIEIILGPAGLMTPMIKGAKPRKSELPLTMTPL